MTPTLCLFTMSVSYLISVDSAVKSRSHSGYALLTVASDGVTSLTFIALSHNIVHLIVLRPVHSMTLDVHNMMLDDARPYVSV